ncbi:MAG: 2-hydroxyacid dehydrogenase [Phycisphaerales bacterium]
MGLPLVVITRGVPGRAEVPGAEVRIARDEPQMTRAELLSFVRGAAAIVTMFHDRVDDEFLDAAGPQLKAVCNFAVGVDNIDVAACRKRGVGVANTPDAVTEGTANLTWALILATARRLAEGDRFVRSGKWEREGNGFPKGWMGVHLTGQTLLVIGAGRIGRAVALRALGFGMRVLYTSRSRKLDMELAPIAATRVELDEGLRLADVVSVHTPLTPETRHILDARRIALLKPTAIVINTSRGPTIDESALTAALTARKIWGAGLDVFEREPAVHADLLTLDNVVMTPHIGSAERKFREMMTQIACANAAAAVVGKPLPNPV